MSLPFKFIAISGYGWSGSGAVVDMLREVDGCGTPGFEFSLIKEPGGIIDLECFLVDNWDVIRQAHAVDQFFSFINILNRPYRRFGHWGLNMGKRLDVDFESLAMDYINKIAFFEYYGYSRVHHYPHGHVASLIRKIGRLAGFDWARGKNMILARPSRENFLEATRTFLNQLFIPMASRGRLHHVILDQAIPTANIDRSLRYFNDAKFILVDRDPRDIYVDQINQRVLIGANLNDPNRVKKFICWYKTLRANKNNFENTSSVMCINFEDFVINHKIVADELLNFLGLNDFYWSREKFFKPHISIKNIGIWRSYINQHEIQEIEDAFA
jgi:hypothetical protein